MSVNRRNTFHMVGCGGGGINIVSFVAASLEQNMACLAAYTKRYIDTSTANITKVDHLPEEFHQIASGRRTVSELTGSGGDKLENLTDITADTKAWIDKNGIVPTPGEYYVIVYSAVGGSGSTIGTELVHQLSTMGVPVIVVLVSETVDLFKTRYGLGTLATLEHRAMNNGYVTPVMYVNHDSVESMGVDKLVKVNTRLASQLEALFYVCSGMHESLDQEDIKKLFAPNTYKTYKFPAGIYGLFGFTGEMLPEYKPEGSLVAVVRHLVPQNSNIPAIDAMHYKVGVIDDISSSDIKAVKVEKGVAIAMVAGYFTSEMSNLDAVLADKTKMANAAMDAIAAGRHSTAGVSVREDGLFI